MYQTVSYSKRKCTLNQLDVALPCRISVCFMVSVNILQDADQKEKIKEE